MKISCVLFLILSLLLVRASQTDKDKSNSEQPSIDSEGHDDKAQTEENKDQVGVEIPKNDNLKQEEKCCHYEAPEEGDNCSQGKCCCYMWEYKDEEEGVNSCCFTRPVRRPNRDPGFMIWGPPFMECFIKAPKHLKLCNPCTFIVLVIPELVVLAYFLYVFIASLVEKDPTKPHPYYLINQRPI